MAKTRKIPLRKSVVSGEIIDKRDLLRIVKTKDGEIFIDPTGKKNGLNLQQIILRILKLLQALAL